VIGGFADLWLAEAGVGTPGRECADQIAKAVQHGAGLTRQLLAFGRGQPGRADVLDLAEVITAVAPMLSRTIGEHVELVIIERPPSERPCLVRIGRGQLEQVVVNLAVNARDAMPDGGRLTIGWELTLQDCAEIGVPVAGGPDKAWFVRLAVSDTGQGMDAETITHAFEPFYTTNGVGHGTGLGLASVYGITAMPAAWCSCTPRSGTAPWSRSTCRPATTRCHRRRHQRRSPQGCTTPHRTRMSSSGTPQSWPP
jgi:signal transduction histidine kinase